MKWELVIDYRNYSELEIYTFNQEPKQRELRGAMVVSYEGKGPEGLLKVFIPLHEVHGWTLEEVGEE